MKATVLLTILGLTFLLTACSDYKFNFTCNDYSSELTLKENTKNLEECSKNQFVWKRTF